MKLAVVYDIGGSTKDLVAAKQTDEGRIALAAARRSGTDRRIFREIRTTESAERTKRIKEAKKKVAKTKVAKNKVA